MLTKTPFYFLRHGETDWNLSNRAQGQTDIELNATGRAQAEEARSLVAALEIKTICVSPLKRAVVTAQILTAGMQRNIQVIDDLKECCWGSHEGQVKGPWYDDWKKGNALPGAEAYDAFIERALHGINQALAAPGPVLIIAHGGIYWAIQHYAELDIVGDIPNCTPVRHDPPASGSPRWLTRSVVDRPVRATGTTLTL
jgi:probable phosphoglycerate mutase